MNSVKVNKRGADRVRKGHLWIYRSDVAEVKDCHPGAIVRVADPNGNFVGQALYSDRSEITLRLLTQTDEVIDREWWRRRLREASARRNDIRPHTNAFRLVYSEGDLLPSLIIDVYDRVLVLQTLSQGTETQKGRLVELLVEEFEPQAIVERND